MREPGRGRVTSVSQPSSRWLSWPTFSRERQPRPAGRRPGPRAAASGHGRFGNAALLACGRITCAPAASGSVLSVPRCLNRFKSEPDGDPMAHGPPDRRPVGHPPVQRRGVPPAHHRHRLEQLRRPDRGRVADLPRGPPAPGLHLRAGLGAADPRTTATSGPEHASRSRSTPTATSTMPARTTRSSRRAGVHPASRTRSTGCGLMIGVLWNNYLPGTWGAATTPHAVHAGRGPAGVRDPGRGRPSATSSPIFAVGGDDHYDGARGECGLPGGGRTSCAQAAPHCLLTTHLGAEHHPARRDRRRRSTCTCTSPATTWRTRSSPGASPSGTCRDARASR